MIRRALQGANNESEQEHSRKFLTTIPMGKKGGKRNSSGNRKRKSGSDTKEENADKKVQDVFGAPPQGDREREKGGLAPARPRPGRCQLPKTQEGPVWLFSELFGRARIHFLGSAGVFLCLAAVILLSFLQEQHTEREAREFSFPSQLGAKP